jgi:hypothetical protein
MGGFCGGASARGPADRQTFRASTWVGAPARGERRRRRAVGCARAAARPDVRRSEGWRRGQTCGGAGAGNEMVIDVRQSAAQRDSGAALAAWRRAGRVPIRGAQR